MGSLSGQFEDMAMSHLYEAHAITRSDQSGHALGTAMWLCQQSFEKMLKSVILKIGERMRLDLQRGILGALSHEVYPKLYELLYAGHIAGVEAPHFTAGGLSADPAGAPDGAPELYKKKGELWGKYLEDGELRELVWKVSLGAWLGADELSRLDRWGAEYSAFLGKIGNMGAPEPLKFKNPMFTPPAMERIFRDDGLLKSLSARYRDSPDSARRRDLLKKTYSMCMAAIERGVTSADGRVIEPRGRLARRLVLEFGFQSLMISEPNYVLVFPHNTIGRYPGVLGDGRSTADTYAAQLDHALYQILTVIPHQVDEVLTASRRLDALCDCGQRTGHWV